MNASLREIVLAVRFGEASLVGESVGYLVLGACDRALAVPRAADLDGVLVTSEGEVVLDSDPVSEAEAERALRTLLGQLLTLLRTSFPNLERVARREPCGLRHLVTELEAALVPVNRRAARRSLSRLVREARRSQAQGERHAAVVDVVPAPVRTAFVAQPAPAPAPAPWFAAPEPRERDGVDEVPSLAVDAVTAVRAPAGPRAVDPVAPTLLAFDPASPAEPEELAEELLSAEVDAAFDAALDDAFDQALTRVATAVETLPPPETRARSGFNLRRLIPGQEVEGPLIPTSAQGTSRPSSIEDLLLRMRVEGEPAESVLHSLALLARVDVSPLAPPVG